jgi:hypothetical protein
MPEDMIEMPDLRNSGPTSVLPYPEDDMPPPNPPYFNSSIRPSSAGGPQADRLSSAFVIRPLQHAPTEPYNHNNGGPDPNGSLRLSANMPPPNGRGGIAPGRDYRDGSVSAGWEAQPQVLCRPGPDFRSGILQASAGPADKLQPTLPAARCWARLWS